MTFVKENVLMDIDTNKHTDVVIFFKKKEAFYVSEKINNYKTRNYTSL